MCLDSSPPIFYLNSDSIDAIHLVHQFNASHPETQASYTFDAGCNPFIIFRRPVEEELTRVFEDHFGEKVLSVVKSDLHMRLN